MTYQAMSTTAFTTTAVPPPTGPRLLTVQGGIGAPVGLREHLARYGAPPSPRGSAGREALIRGVERSGLTGRGGGAFPAGRKLRAVAGGRRAGTVVVNGSEGEPASAKDRTLLSLTPHLVLDGALLSAAAVGAREIVVCVHRQSVAELVRRALAERAAAGLATVPARVHVLDDGYVASEASSLVRSINGGAAVPLPKSPPPWQRGVGGRPTLISNAETFAHIALIARFGPEWFRSAGTAEAPGTALFTVDGAVRGPGVYEAALGTPLIEVLGLAGGLTGPVQAVLVGGYGGGWLPAAELRSPATHDKVAERGAGLGAGILFALPAHACGLAETARVLAWMAGQSAGQCGPCMFGLPAIAADFAALTWGGPAPSRLSTRLATVPGRGACAHPDGAVRFAVSALRVFADHLADHTRYGPCPAAWADPLLPLPEEPEIPRPQSLAGTEPEPESERPDLLSFFAEVRS